MANEYQTSGVRKKRGAGVMYSKGQVDLTGLKLGSLKNWSIELVIA